MAKCSNETNLIIQSACAAVLITELNRDNRLLQSEFFKDLEFLTPTVKDMISYQIGVVNYGGVLMILYALLVVPKELLQNKYSSEYAAIDKYIETIVITKQTDYKRDDPQVQYVKHMRNSVAHLRVKFTDNESVIFCDSSPKGEHCHFEIPFSELIPLINKFLEIHKIYAAALPQ